MPSRPIPQLLDLDLPRFWVKVRRGTVTECWPWIAARLSNGYGVFVLPRAMGPQRLIYAHRMSWVVSHGEDIPPGLFVLHVCDNPPCCNPLHLRIGTAQDNMRDCVNKGRLRPGDATGENNPASKLTWSEVEDIRRIAATRTLTKASIGDLFGVSASTVKRIISRRLWNY